MEKTPCLELKNITKKYGNTKVLENISFSVNKGEIHGLLGENGAGKSTLMNILLGMPAILQSGGFEGEIYLDGKQVSPKSPAEAMELGMGMVHQEFFPVESFSAAENISLNQEPVKKSLLGTLFSEAFQHLDRAKMKQQAEDTLSAMGISFDVNLTAENLGIGPSGFLEIARELCRENRKLLIFDEPTAVMNQEESRCFLAVLKRLADQGISILLITHRLEELFAVTERVTVLQDGRNVGTFLTKDTTPQALAKAMTGQDFQEGTAKTVGTYSGNPKLSLRHVSVEQRGESVTDINLDLYKGEALGVYSPTGQGMTALMNGLMGFAKTIGEVLVDGQPLDLNNIPSLYKAKLAFVSEDRKGQGIWGEGSVAENICMSAMMAQKAFLKRSLLLSMVDYRGMESLAKKMIAELDIRCHSPWQKVRELSGGNQQKVCLARALALQPEVLLVAEVTRGVDLGAREQILQKLENLQGEGMTILMASANLGELKRLCGRIAVLNHGRLWKILDASAPEDAFLHLKEDSL